MKAVALESADLTLPQLLDAAQEHGVVFLKTGGKTRFAVVPADEADEEVCSLQSHVEFLTYLTEAEQRARTAPRKSLREIRETFGEPRHEH